MRSASQGGRDTVRRLRLLLRVPVCHCPLCAPWFGELARRRENRCPAVTSHQPGREIECAKFVFDHFAKSRTGSVDVLSVSLECISAMRDSAFLSKCVLVVKPQHARRLINSVPWLRQTTADRPRTRPQQFRKPWNQLNALNFRDLCVRDCINAFERRKRAGGIVRTE